MKNNNIIRNCDRCGNEDSINSFSGLCPSCEKQKVINKVKTLFEKGILTKEEYTLYEKEQQEVIKQQIKESNKENQEQTNEDISNILARQRNKERGFKIE